MTRDDSDLEDEVGLLVMNTNNGKGNRSPDGSVFIMGDPSLLKSNTN